MSRAASVIGELRLRATTSSPLMVRTTRCPTYSTISPHRVAAGSAPIGIAAAFITSSRLKARGKIPNQRAERSSSGRHLDHDEFAVIAVFVRCRHNPAPTGAAPRRRNQPRRTPRPRRSQARGCGRLTSRTTRTARRRTGTRQRARPRWQRSPRVGGGGVAPMTNHQPTPLLALVWAVVFTILLIAAVAIFALVLIRWWRHESPPAAPSAALLGHHARSVVSFP